MIQIVNENFIFVKKTTKNRFDIRISRKIIHISIRVIILLV